MPRELSAKDSIVEDPGPRMRRNHLRIVRYHVLVCSPAGSRHFASDEDDFRARIARLDNSGLEYLIGCIPNRSESPMVVSDPPT
jgi:hypothetical protein